MAQDLHYMIIVKIISIYYIGGFNYEYIEYG